MNIDNIIIFNRYNYDYNIFYVYFWRLLATFKLGFVAKN